MAQILESKWLEVRIIHDVNFHIITINMEGIEVKPTKLPVLIIHFLERREYPDQAALLLFVKTCQTGSTGTETEQTRGWN